MYTRTIPAGRIKRIHISQPAIRANLKDDENRPVMRVKMSDENIPGHRIKVNGPCEILYNTHTPLSCGARVWIETRSEVLVEEGTICGSGSQSESPPSPLTSCSPSED